ncbi:MAG: hypothetical protein BroJett013_17840 [Alphaproteobacteria bacterium]|nr:MAG: hypothetical protein BroJett013_17840 [Alphaproteobacteria bacterium]
MRETVDTCSAFSAPPCSAVEPTAKAQAHLFWGVLDAMVAADANAPLKQRHAHQGALRNEYGYSGGDDQVREAVRERRQRLKEAFVSLAHRLANCPPDRIDEVARWFETQGVVPIVG